MNPKRTAFYGIHKTLGAKIVEFAGFEMPIQYAGIVEEHRRVRESGGVFDVSHMGEVELSGKNALAFIQTMTVNDAAKLGEGRVQYSAMCYDDGGIIDDLLVYNLGDRYMLVINAANVEKDIAWMNDHLVPGVTLTNRSDETSLLAVQGPQSLSTLQQLTAVDLSRIPYYHFQRGSLAGVDMIISRTGYTGELGFELYFPSDIPTGEKVWTAIMEAGKDRMIVPVGLGARDTLRLEMGFCLYGHDIDQTTNPIEAGLGWITKLEKQEFHGREAMQKTKREGPGRKLVGFSVDEKAFPRQGYTIQAEGKTVGMVTSGTFSPTLDQGIGLGYVDAAHARQDTPLAIRIRNKDVPATVVQVPFIKK